MGHPKVKCINVIFDRSFIRDLRGIRDATLRQRIDEVINEVKAAASPQDIAHLTKLSGFPIHFRIRVGTFRLGVIIQGDSVTFARCLPRDQIYHQFP